MSPCSCGCLKAHRIARRTTLDGVAVELWSDGWLTCRMGTQIGRLRATLDLDRASMWTFADLIGWLDFAEVRAAVRHWKRARRLVGATDQTARAEVLYRLRAPRKAPPAGPDALYRELRLANGMSVDIRIK